MILARILAQIFALLVIILVNAACTTESRQDTGNARKAQTAPEAAVRTERGEMLFKQFCANCHPDGGNVSDPARNLHGSTLRANHINKPEDIVRIMRNPISRMLRFDAATLSDDDARSIAVYVLETF